MIRITLRVPEGLYADILASAADSRRSINAQILWLVEQGLQDGRD